jgi:hypothetical protein
MEEQEPVPQFGFGQMVLPAQQVLVSAQNVKGPPGEAKAAQAEQSATVDQLSLAIATPHTYATARKKVNKGVIFGGPRRKKIT